MQGLWACRSLRLECFYSEAAQIIEGMEAAGVQIIVEHIYREYNKLADKCANIAVDTRTVRGWHAPQ
jgi:hypothetical protein